MVLGKEFISWAIPVAKCLVYTERGELIKWAFLPPSSFLRYSWWDYQKVS
jgi:hypothetical protein